MATYVNDLRLTELATGEGSGTWGTTTNTNLELIGEALGFGTQDCFTTDADATTTVADGATDPARAMYFKVTSSATLTATRTLTIGPNTVSRVMWIENATTGSQSIAISQGSGANVTIATGKAAVVYLDGAGATAAVVDAMNLVDPGVTDTLAEVLVAGNATGGTNILFGDNDKAIFGAGSDLQIYHDGSNSYVADSGTGRLFLSSDGDGVNIVTSTGENLIRTDNDGQVRVYFDDSEKLRTNSAGIDVTGTVTADGLTVAGTTTLTGDFNVQDSTNYGVEFRGTAPSVTSISLQGRFRDDTDAAYWGGANIEFIRDGNWESSITFDTSPDYTNRSGLPRLNIAKNGDISFYEDTGTTPKFFWDASAESLGIGTTSPATALDVAGTVTADGLTVSPSSGDATLTLSSNASQPWEVYSPDASNDLRFKSDSTDYVTIDTSGNVGIGTTSPTGITSGITTLAISDAGAKTTGDKTGALAFITNDGSFTGTFADGVTAEISSVSETGVGGAYGLAFATSTTSGSNRAERMRLDSSGNLLVGTTSGSAKITASNAGVTTTTLMALTDAGGTGTHTQISFNNTNGQVGTISTSGSATAYNTSSDARLKENIADAEDAGAKVDAIQVRQFDWKADGSHQDYGMIAQELLTVAPEAVSGDPESDDMMGVDYSKLVPMLVKEIQSLRARVAQLEGA